MASKILIVDDSEALRHILSLVLIENGYEVIEASDGIEGMSKLNGEKIKLMLCDVNMPNMDGYEFVQKVRQMPDYKFTPVIMLTTESSVASKQKGKDAGASGWMVKPFKPAALLDAVSKLVTP